MRAAYPPHFLVNQLDGYNGRMGDSSSEIAARRELVFMCADSGAVVALSYEKGNRPVLTRAVVFLAAGETLWADNGPGSGSRSGLTVRERGTSGHYDLRLSVQGWPLPGPAELAGTACRAGLADLAGTSCPAGTASVAGRRVPVGLELTVEPASNRLALGRGTAEGDVTLVRGTGSLSVGSVIRRVEGSGWSAAGPSGAPGAAAGCRARAVFQDGSALYAVDGAGGADATGGGATARAAGVAAGRGSITADAPLAALVRNTQIRAVEVGDITVRGTERGLPGRAVSWGGSGNSPTSAAARAAGEIRDPRQRVTVTSQDPGGAGLVAWSCAPFVFVRSGVTGLGLVERCVRLGDGATLAEAAEGLPDPF